MPRRAGDTVTKQALILELYLFREEREENKKKGRKYGRRKEGEE
jgi:hypothetical protein